MNLGNQGDNGVSGQVHILKGKVIGIAIGSPLRPYDLIAVHLQNHVVAVHFDQLLLGFGGDGKRAVRAGIFDDVSKKETGSVCDTYRNPKKI